MADFETMNIILSRTGNDRICEAFEEMSGLLMPLGYFMFFFHKPLGLNFLFVLQASTKLLELSETVFKVKT